MVEEKKNNRKGGFFSSMCTLVASGVLLYNLYTGQFELPQFKSLSPKIQTTIKSEAESLPQLLNAAKNSIENGRLDEADGLLNDVSVILKYLLGYFPFNNGDKYREFKAQVEVYRALIKETKELEAKTTKLNEEAIKLKGKIEQSK